MLYFPQTRIDISKERPIATGAKVLAEGSPLFYTNVGGVIGVAPLVPALAGGSVGNFAGVAFNGVMNTAADVPFLEQVVVSAGPASAYGVAAISFKPTGGAVGSTYASMFVLDLTTGTALTAPGTPVAPGSIAANNYEIDAFATGGSNLQQIDVPAALIGHTLAVAYRYPPTTLQWTFLQGMQLPGGPSGPYLGQMDVAQRGDVYTSEFDTQVNWSAYTNQAVGVNNTTGLFTFGLGGGQTNIAGATLIALPGVSSPFLGIAIDVA